MLNEFLHRLSERFGNLQRRSGLYFTRPLSTSTSKDVNVFWNGSRPKDGTFTMPSLAGARIAKLSPFSDNFLILAAGRSKRCRVKVTSTQSCKGNLLILGRRSDAPRSVRFESNDSQLVIGDDVCWCLMSFRATADRNGLFFGRGAISNGVSAILGGDDRKIWMGDECLFAPGITIRTSDLHGIYDRATGEHLNCPADVVIEPRCWLAQDVLVLKGVTIGGGGVVGARSLVNRDLPRFAISAGSPARAIRTNIGWSLDRDPRPTERTKTGRAHGRVACPANRLKNAVRTGVYHAQYHA